MSRLKLLYIIGQLRRGGAEQQLYYLLQQLPDPAIVVSLEKDHPDTYWTEPMRALGHQVVEIPRRGSFDFGRIRVLTALIRREKPSIVHLFTDTPSGIYGRIACILAGQKYVVIGERRHPQADPRWYRLLKRYVLNSRVSAVIANAEASRQFLIEQENLAPSRVHYIPNGIDLSRFQPAANRTQPRGMLPESWRDKKIVINVGSLLPKKAPEVYVAVAKAVMDQYPEARFLHVGRGRLLQEVRALSEQLGLADRLIFMGERTDIPDILHACDLFVMTSRNEGTPNAAMEAMATGLPCVLTDTGDCRTLIKDGSTGYVVPLDPTLLTDRIVQLLRDDPARQAMGVQALQAIQQYSIPRMAEQYLNIYKSLAS
ncbi:MAG: glycosyltransferase [Anaerolineae bacterium]